MSYEYLIKNRARENENIQDATEIENYRTHEYLLDVINNIKSAHEVIYK
jgi:hypothetical protein